MDIYNKLLLDLDDHSFREYPLEATGIITMDYKYVPTRNISETPMTNFEFDPDILEVYSDNIWATFHSHPNFNPDAHLPSTEDYENTITNRYKHLVGFNSNYYLYYYKSDNEYELKKFEMEDLT